MKALFVVTSLMGAGHLTRTLILARAVAAAGARAVVVSGGRNIPHAAPDGVELVQMPPVWSDGVDYSRLLTPGGVADQAYLDARAARLCAALDEIAPDVIVTELWPFGRRALSGEFEALLNHAAGRARVYASIRDVLEPKRKAKRVEETAARLRRWYDGVLVHGDAAVVDLAATWPLAAEFAGGTRYTGYVAAPPPAPIADGAGDVLVAVGGGVIGRDLLQASIEAARIDASRAGGRRPRRWRLRVGGVDAAAEVQRLTALAVDAPLVVEPAAADYRARLAAASCSLTLFGYNTATDLLAAGTPAVIAPMDEGGEREQIIRADAFAGLPGFTRLTARDPRSIAAAVAAATDGPGPARDLVDLNGAARTAEILLSG
ncbi:MAG: glycosyltransferase [Pseudomonadota bacterium]